MGTVNFRYCRKHQQEQYWTIDITTIKNNVHKEKSSYIKIATQLNLENSTWISDFYLYGL